MKRLSITNILAQIDEMFSEVLEVSELPPDWPKEGKITLAGAPCEEKYLGRVWPSKNEGKFFIMRKLENRRDPEKLSAIIERQMNNYLTLEKDSDKYMFRQYRLERIAEYEAEFCYDLHNGGMNKKRTICKDLKAYKAVLMELVPDAITPETKPKDRHPEKSPFTTPKAFETFKYLCDYYPNQKKSRWTYLLHFITEESDIDPRINEEQYWDWITEHYNFDGAKKKQGGSSRKEYGKLRELHKVYLNEQV